MRVRTPVGRIPWWVVLSANFAFWPSWTFAAGYLASRASADTFTSENWLTRERGWEQRGTWYSDRLRINAWKDEVPEAGAMFGGVAKRSVGNAGSDELFSFAAETRRAERVHWLVVGGVGLTTLWNPWWALPINAAVAVASNAPCIAVQRYNRARIERVLLRRSTLTCGR